MSAEPHSNLTSNVARYPAYRADSQELQVAPCSPQAIGKPLCYRFFEGRRRKEMFVFRRDQPKTEAAHGMGFDSSLNKSIPNCVANEPCERAQM